jgi:hypothetical protein
MLFRKAKQDGLNGDDRIEDLKHDCYQDLIDVAKGTPMAKTFIEVQGNNVSLQKSNQEEKRQGDDEDRWINFWTGDDN